MREYQETLPEEPLLQIYTGEELKQLTSEQKKKLCTQISASLGAHSDTMLQYSPEEIEAIINESRGVAIIHPLHGGIQAFAQISPWEDRESGEILATEFRSWLSVKPGAGILALRAAVGLNQSHYPNIPMYAVIEEGNIRAQARLLQVGAEEVPMPHSMKVELKAGQKPAPVKTFSLAKIKS